MSEQSKNKIGKAVTRRAMLGAGAAAGAAFALGSGAEAAPQAMPESWDEEVDVIIVGTGFAGLAAAIEATKAGASVALLEKMRTPGGNSIISGGVIAAAGSPLQAEEGIEDSVQTLIDDMMKAGLNLNHPELVRIIAEKSVETVQWTIDELGVEYRGLAHMGGHAVPRSYALAAGSGSGIVVPQLDKLKEMGVEPRTRTLMKHLLRDPDGRVKGVIVHEKYRHPDLDSGTPKSIKARKAVIMATGGFGNDPSFRKLQDPRLGGELDTTNHPGATAQPLREAMNIGCTLVQPSWIQLGPWTSPDERGFGYAPHFVQGVAASYGLWVDTQTGKRFVNELADRKTRADAILAAGNKCIAFSDADGYVKGSTGRPTDNLDKMKEAGVLLEYPSLEEMAAAHNIPLDALKETIETFNAGVDAGEDSEMGRYMSDKVGKIGTAPFYVVRLSPKVHHTMGGCAINEKAEAIDVVSGEPIVGLYVVGEAAGGVHGASRLGSCAYADCLTFGRIAGQNAAAVESWS
ncbi:flavocytochrome c [Actibacterium lipolyticum]|uniref:Fumarate reductase flavoprotein subunit n=1 Tax=Actibacterium lipolyticum TaxID=1524263 RepID=A0A238KKT9_9RHOB|nr:flavocytochrome c [Actibacterium lipolyticum]SMX43374.1 Fumarate reductase flavoprotein subunit precursor [Actibacterium lipolyticum]